MSEENVNKYILMNHIKLSHIQTNLSKACTGNFWTFTIRDFNVLPTTAMCNQHVGYTNM